MKTGIFSPCCRILQHGRVENPSFMLPAMNTTLVISAIGFGVATMAVALIIAARRLDPNRTYNRDTDIALMATLLYLALASIILWICVLRGVLLDHTSPSVPTPTDVIGQ